MVSRRNVQCNSEVTLRNIYLFICIEAVSGVMPWLRLLLFYVHNIGMQFFSFEYKIASSRSELARSGAQQHTKLLSCTHFTAPFNVSHFSYFFFSHFVSLTLFLKNVTINFFRVQSSRPRIHKRSEFDTSTATVSMQNLLASPTQHKVKRVKSRENIWISNGLGVRWTWWIDDVK